MPPDKTNNSSLEIVPAILKNNFESIIHDWNLVKDEVGHIQLDITDGVFTGDGTFRDIPRFKQLMESEKAELHLMVINPAYYLNDIIDLAPARCIFHLEAFAGSGDISLVYTKLRENTQTELALALNPDSPNERVEEFLPLIDYVLFMGYNPGWANQPINPIVYRKIGSFRKKHPYLPIAVDGHVDKTTVVSYVKAGANILCSNTAIFSQGNPLENIQQLQLLANM